MSREEIIQIITENIYPNGNNEITANVLNPVLDAMVNQINDITGNLGDLASTDTSNLVNAINSVITQFEGIDSNSVKLRSGIDNPNITPPDEYNTADFYIQEDTEGNPLELWQFNGIRWNKENAENDRFTSLGTLVKEGNEITLGLGYAWIIDDILYSNSVEQEFIIQEESTGQSRVDIIVTFGNGFSLIQGLPSAGEGSAAQPQIPVGSLLLSSINIYEDNISEPTEPFDSQYLQVGDNISLLNNDAVYVTLDDIPEQGLNEVLGVNNVATIPIQLNGIPYLIGDSSGNVVGGLLGSSTSVFIFLDVPNFSIGTTVDYFAMNNGIGAFNLNDRLDISANNNVEIVSSNVNLLATILNLSASTINLPNSLDTDNTVTKGLARRGSDNKLVEFDIPTPIIFTTDASLYLDPTTNELRANTGLSTENFEYTSGVQEFDLVDEPSFVFSLMLNLVAINNPLTDYSIDGKKLTILKKLEPTDKINITYQFIITI